MQGLYGPFTMAERVLQKIWLQQDFASTGARLEDGRTIEVISPGKWNLLGGPDFKAARLRIGECEVIGDIEVHFHASDWHAHGHRSNPAYANVVLHVLLFPSDAGERPARNGAGATIPALVLLPLLHRDLEDYAADDALESMTARDEWRRTAELANRPLNEVRALLRQLARERWRRKVHYARTRIERLGWEEAAHHTALEILGYRHNRVPMLAVAARWPLPAWRGASELSIDALMRAAGDNWQRHGVRPANHPATRLAQYRAWVMARPDWPARLAAWAEHLRAVGHGSLFETAAIADGEDVEAPDRFGARAGSVVSDVRATDAVEPPSAVPSRPSSGLRATTTPAPLATATGAYRRRCGLRLVSENLAESVAADCVGGSRWHTLVCDGLLPLAAAQTELDLGALWFHWFPGDVPDQVRRALRQLAVTGGAEQAHCHGFGQGLLAWFIQRDVPA